MGKWISSLISIALVSVPNIAYSYAQTSKTNHTSLTKSDQDKTDISTLFSGDLNMGIFSSNNQPKDNDILQFLYDHVSDPSNKHVINDLIVGNRGTSGDTVSVTVSAKDTSAEYTGSVNVTYQISNGVDLASVITQAELWRTSIDSPWLDEPSSKDVITKVKELNSSININAIDVNRSTFQYDTTYNEYTVKIVPVSWSSQYTGQVVVRWAPGLKVKAPDWNQTSVPYNYSKQDVRLEVDKSLPADATVTYKFENGQTTYGNFSISGATLSFNTGANASATAYTCKIKATITGNTTYAGTTQTVSTSITVTKINFPDLGNLLLDGTFHQDINPTTISLNTAKQYTLSLSNSAPLNTTFSYTCISRTANTGYFPSASSFTISGSTLSISAITTPGSFYLTIRVTATNSPNYNDWTKDFNIPIAIIGKINPTLNDSAVKGKQYDVSSEYNYDKFGGWKAFDGGTGNCWSTVANGFSFTTGAKTVDLKSNPAWVWVDTGGNHLYYSYSITRRPNLSDWQVCSWILQKSASASGPWDDLNTQSDIAWDANTTEKTFNISSFDMTHMAVYYRLYITKISTTGSTTDTWTGVAELTINGA